VALAQYRILFQQHWSSFDGGSIGYFDSVTAARLVAAGIGTALDALPATVSPPAPGMPVGDYIDDGGLPVSASAADSAILQSVAGLLPGN